MKKILLIIIGAILILVIAFFALNSYIYHEKQAESPEIEQPDTLILDNPSFEWVYVESFDTEIPYTNISLTARNPDGSTFTKEIDTIAGGCNEYEEADADAYPKSTIIICYYAGLGHYFKVVESGEQYMVLRKVFEEASPEYDPPVEEFEVVAQF